MFSSARLCLCKFVHFVQKNLLHTKVELEGSQEYGESRKRAVEAVPQNNQFIACMTALP